MALVACQFTDKPHEQAFIEEYIDVASEPAVTKDVQSWLATERLAAAWKAAVTDQKK